MNIVLRYILEVYDAIAIWRFLQIGALKKECRAPAKRFGVSRRRQVIELV